MNQRLLLLAFAVSLSVLGIWTVGPLPAAKGAEFFCRDRVLTEYAQPLERMPGDRLPGERLSFAPRDVELRLGRSVIVDGEPITYTLALNRFDFPDQNGPRPADLHWALSLGLAPVNRQGLPTAAAEWRRWRIGIFRSSERRFELRADPGLYRVSVKIRKLDGPVLGRYRQFVRVLPSRWDLSVSIRDGESFRPGETVTARLENRGTREVFFPESSTFTVERLESGTWARIMPEEALSWGLEQPEFLDGGRASACEFFTIPPDSPPGAFRFSVNAEMGASKPRPIFGQFFVL